MTRDPRPPVKALVLQASSALARLDVPRLEEIAESCRALEAEAVSPEDLRDCIDELAILGRVLQATRENIRVMQRLRELRQESIEYSERAIAGMAESIDGQH